MPGRLVRSGSILVLLCAACSSSPGGGTTGSTGITATGTAGSGGGSSTGAGSEASTGSSGASRSGTTGGSGSSTGSGGSTGASTTSGGSSTAGGTTYYVSPNGDDSNPGTQSAPWATIQNAGTVVQPGDTVIVEAGTYDGAIFGWDAPPCTDDPLCTVAGTAEAPITFEADPSAAAGSVVIGASNGENENGFDLEPGCDYVDIVGFTVNDDGSADEGSGTITKAGIAISGCTGNRVAGNTVNGVSGIGGILVDTSVDVIVEGNTCTNVQGTGTTGHGMYVSGSSVGVQVLDNLLYDNDYVGLHVNGDVSEGLPGVVTGLLIAGNVIYGNGQNGINADGIESSTIENNVIYDNARNGIELYQIDAYGGSANNVIVNNTIDQSMVPTSYALEVSACAYDNQSSQPTPAGCQTSPYDTSTGNISFDDVLLGGAGADSVVASDDLALASNLTSESASLFVNAAGGDYTLAAGGAGFGTGVASFDGAAAPDAGSGYDIGAFLFGLP